jgi:hypothetical protein
MIVPLPKTPDHLYLDWIICRGESLASTQNFISMSSGIANALHDRYASEQIVRAKQSSTLSGRLLRRVKNTLLAMTEKKRAF